MARSDRQEQPMIDEELESMPERIGRHFDLLHDLLDREIAEFS